MPLPAVHLLSIKPLLGDMLTKLRATLTPEERLRHGRHTGVTRLSRQGCHDP